MGCLNKYDSDVKLEAIPRDHRPNTNVTPPIGHSLNTIYETYNNDYVYGKVHSSPERTTNLYNLSSNYASDATNHKSQHKEYGSVTNLVDEFPLRPPLWEDITSSIQNIDPENAIMLGSIATHVKLESNDPDHFIEPLSSSPLLSSLDIKAELKQQIVLGQVPTSTILESSHDLNNRQQLSMPMVSHSSAHPNNGSISNNCINLDNNDDNNNSNNHYNTYNLLCGSASVISHYEPNHYDQFGHVNNFNETDHNNIVAMQIHQHIHQHTHIQHSHYHVSPPIPNQNGSAQHHPQHSGNHLYAHNWQNQGFQVSVKHLVFFFI